MKNFKHFAVSGFGFLVIAVFSFVFCIREMLYSPPKVAISCDIQAHKIAAILEEKSAITTVAVCNDGFRQVKKVSVSYAPFII